MFVKYDLKKKIRTIFWHCKLKCEFRDIIVEPFNFFFSSLCRKILKRSDTHKQTYYNKIILNEKKSFFVLNEQNDDAQRIMLFVERNILIIRRLFNFAKQ